MSDQETPTRSPKRRGSGALDTLKNALSMSPSSRQKLSLAQLPTGPTTSEQVSQKQQQQDHLQLEDYQSSFENFESMRMSPGSPHMAPINTNIPVAASPPIKTPVSATSSPSKSHIYPEYSTSPSKSIKSATSQYHTSPSAAAAALASSSNAHVKSGRIRIVDSPAVMPAVPMVVGSAATVVPYVASEDSGDDEAEISGISAADLNDNNAAEHSYYNFQAHDAVAAQSAQYYYGDETSSAAKNGMTFSPSQDSISSNFSDVIESYNDTPSDALFHSPTYALTQGNSAAIAPFVASSVGATTFTHPDMQHFESAGTIQHGTPSDSSSSYVHVGNERSNSIESSFHNLSVGSSPSVGTNTNQEKQQQQQQQQQELEHEHEHEHEHDELLPESNLRSVPDLLAAHKQRQSMNNYQSNIDYEFQQHMQPHDETAYHTGLESHEAYGDQASSIMSGETSSFYPEDERLNVPIPAPATPNTNLSHDPQHILQKYHPKHGSFASSMHPPVHGGAGHSYSASTSSSVSGRRYLNAPDPNSPARTSIISTASSAILDSSGGIPNLSESSNVSLNNLSRNGSGSSHGNMHRSQDMAMSDPNGINDLHHDNMSIYSTVSTGTIKNGLAHSAGDLVDNDVVVPPGGHVAPLNLGDDDPNNAGQQLFTRTNELLMNRQASGGKTGVATVSVEDKFKNEHIRAPVIIDDITGDPLVFYPAPIPVQLKLPPLLSKRNQELRAAAMLKARQGDRMVMPRGAGLTRISSKAIAKKNRPKTFMIPPPPVWNVDPTVMPDAVMKHKRTTSSGSSIMLDRRRSSSRLSMLTMDTDVLPIDGKSHHRRKSSTGTLGTIVTSRHKRKESQGSIGTEIARTEESDFDSDSDSDSDSDFDDDDDDDDDETDTETESETEDNLEVKDENQEMDGVENDANGENKIRLVVVNKDEVKDEDEEVNENREANNEEVHSEGEFHQDEVEQVEGQELGDSLKKKKKKKKSKKARKARKARRARKAAAAAAAAAIASEAESAVPNSNEEPIEGEIVDREVVPGEENVKDEPVQASEEQQLQQTEDSEDADKVIKLDALNVPKQRKSKRMSTVSKISYIDGGRDDWDDDYEEEEYESQGEEEGEDVDEDDDDEGEYDNGFWHYLNDEVVSDCATLPSDEEYQEDMLDDDSETEKNKTEAEREAERLGMGNMNIDDFAFTSFNPNSAVTDRGLLAGSLSYSSGLYPAVGVQPRSLIEELEIRKAERKARVQKVYYDINTGNAIAADMYGRQAPDPDQLIRYPNSEHPLNERMNKSLLELQQIAQKDYRGELQHRRRIQDLKDAERQAYVYGGFNGSKAMLNHMGLLQAPASEEPENPNETLKERRERLKRKKQEERRKMEALMASIESGVSMPGEGGIEDDEEEPPGETLAERRARIKKKKRAARAALESNGEQQSLLGTESILSSAA
ncbi:uncharacterized protein SAPINGB_P004011 [Magnusiomyces paraingens]|uniref:Uncharacterized protein n=1 Tax=Magnusiomyces paraingens TaxID=2606893 RepID=A0A5E8BUI1_9ASCO|nr:uncharacterized protein SAPINGB_P004011 [Saprochaete ingens]VVT54309.1 unnamed protein product [Saprochaete ingens]